MSSFKRVGAMLTVAVVGLSITLTGAATAQTFRASEPAPRAAGFAAAMVFEGGEIFVGRPGEIPFFPIPPNHAGSVHIFGSSDGGAWEETGTVSAASVEVGDRFGMALSVEGNTLLVGAPKTGGNRGAVYVFQRTNVDSEWTLVTRLTGAGTQAGDEFGGAVSLAGEFALVGAPGRAEGTGTVVVFRSRGGNWSEVGTLEGSSAGAGERFGATLAADGNRVMVGAPGAFPGLVPGAQTRPMPGSVYVYELENGSYVERARLTSSDDDDGRGMFGHALVLEGDEAFVGTPLGNNAAGVVYRFTRTSGGWAESGRLTAATPVPQSGFGMALAHTGTDVLVGAPLAGTAYVIRRSGDDWNELQILTTEHAFSFMGVSVVAEAGVAVVGVPGADFFEGVGDIYRRDGSGEWAAAGSILDVASGMESIVGSPSDCGGGEVAGFSCSDVDLISFLSVKDLGGDRGMMVNDIWGWTDPETGIEWALVGRMDAMTFVDLSDPANPRYVGELPLTEGATRNLWRDVKVYADHAFIVSDGAGAHGVQIFDLTQLRDVAGPPVTFEETAHYDGIFSAHNIVINEDTGFAYAVGSSMGGETCGGGLHMIDVRDPTNPTFAGCFSDSNTGNAGTGYSHDAQCITYAGPDDEYRGHEICFGSNETALSIGDVTDKANPVAISSATYPNAAYVHQGWISDDHRFFFVNDEGDEIAGTVTRTRTLVWDIEDLDDPVLATEHLGTTSASDHNLYVRGQFMYQSNYVSGLRILDISDPANPREVAYFDSVPVGGNDPGFAGSWSNYPFFESGIIVFTSMREGLLIVRKRRQPIT